ncbi:Predicted alpha/beta hydrolase [Ferrimonas sediminum]|uniref:Predicted alpha/beta hydrolase n=1 Tax=Ferrimonas sediminum TaxID=718193 RepID=A0A1G9AQ11_9GAMM|nr:alpha/beta fold hydrolase [Ferrimonas sediminum]SDK28635.1 Predicted alpha/beta hydrolase [Ferrimonas sediminum]
MQKELQPLITGGGYEIVSTWYCPDYEPVATVILAAAMGVEQEFYQPLACWLSEQGYRVITFDYYGCGRSWQGPLSRCGVDLMDWARFDCAAVINAAYRHDSTHPLYWIGHSLGGQLLGMIPNARLLSKVITIACGSGYWLDNAPSLKRRVWLLWYVLAPLSTAVLGYFPGARLKMVGDLPGAVMRQWRRWCLHPRYAVGVEGEPIKAGYAALACPITAISFEDDELLSRTNIDSLHGFFTGTQVTMYHLSREDCDGRRVGHLGFFRPRFLSNLWASALLPELQLNSSSRRLCG